MTKLSLIWGGAIYSLTDIVCTLYAAYSAIWLHHYQMALIIWILSEIASLKVYHYARDMKEGRYDKSK